MRAAFKVYHRLDCEFKNYILVGNYSLKNKICHYCFGNLKTALLCKDECDIGIWKIKHLKN